jgi:phosphatidylglycerophosphatase A
MSAFLLKGINMTIKYQIPQGIDPKRPSSLLATWFGCGYLHPAPGTWGTLGAIPFGLILFALGGPILLIIGICIVSAIGLWAADDFGKAVNEPDAKQIVIDEVAGMWIALIPAALNPLLIVVAFAAFRFFDILKPWPVSFADKNFKNATGVMLDDILAGFYAYLCVLVVDVWI